MSQEKLAAILEKGDAKACMHYFAGLTEKHRQAHADQVRKWLVSVAKDSFIETKPGTFTPNPQREAAEVAAYWACTYSDLKKLGWRAFPRDEHLLPILSARRPPWLGDWAKWVCEVMPHRWDIVRRFVREGLCPAPETDHYILGMIVGVCAFHENKNTIYAALLEERELLEKDIWRLFEVEGDKEFCLASRDKYSRGENNWTYALVRLSNEKKLSRARLLDSSLDALRRDYAQFHAGWFSQFHEALEPTIKERQERCESYLALLASKIPPTVSFALKALEILVKENKVNPNALATAMKPVMWSRQKGTVRLALQLMDSAARNEPGVRNQVSDTAAEALAHESADVQKQAIGLLEKYACPMSAGLLQILRDKLDQVAASQRERLQKLIAGSGTATDKPAKATRENKKPEGTNEKALRKRAATLDKKWRELAGVDDVLAALDANSVNIPALEFDPMAVPRLDPNQQIKPIEDLDELIDAFAHALEEIDDPMEIERVLDGVSRLCDRRPEDFAVRTGPLLKRVNDLSAKSFWQPFSGAGPFIDLRGLAKGWITGEIVVHKPDHEADFPNANRPTVMKFLSRRVLAVARRAAKRHAAPMLGMPTHTGGWIDPRTLVERALVVQKQGLETDKSDQVQSLLRLAPEHRDAALRNAKKIEGEFGQALRYALEGNEKIGSDKELWVAAVRTRAPGADSPELEKKHPGLGPDAGITAKYQARIETEVHGKFRFRYLCIDIDPLVPTKVDADRATVLIHPVREKKNHRSQYHIAFGKEGKRWARTVWPIQHESWFAGSVGPFAENLDWWEARWDNRTLVEPLLDPDVPLQPMALLMLALGLSAKDPGENGLATDALIAAIEDGRLDAVKLGATVAFLIPMIKHARFARSLGQAARISRLHLHAVARIIENSLRGDPDQAPRDVHALLELLKESLLELGWSVRDADVRAYLQKIGTGGRTARLVRELLALKSNPKNSISQQALQLALEHRLNRAEAWSRRAE